MKMNKVVLILGLGLLIASCGSQKTITLANGDMVSQKQYDRMLDKSFKAADKAGRHAVKGEMSRGDIRRFKNDVNISVDTTKN